jgi:hypothetical protein
MVEPLILSPVPRPTHWYSMGAWIRMNKLPELDEAVEDGTAQV